MKKISLVKNSIASLVLQLTTIVWGLIFPRLILGAYGSEANGLVNSVTQFLSVISFLELGVGAVVQSTLYKPLANKDNVAISEIIASASRFFKKLAIILLIYIILLMVFYPLFVRNDFERIFSALLILCMSISNFAQYYWGVVDRLLLTADQRGYIQYSVQIITLVANTIISAVLVNVGASLHIVQLMASIVFLIRPIIIRMYVNSHYCVNRKIDYKGEPIKQKWDGVAQHLAAMILDGTDTIVLTLFSSLQNVSIYSVYHLVVMGVKRLFMSFTAGVQALMGELWAKQEPEEIRKIFCWLEWGIHTGTVFVYGCVMILIVPFICVYTKGISDADYVKPLFAILIVMANAGHCLRIPYHELIKATGHYKQTQSNYIVAAILNIVISVLTVKSFGLIGVAIGTLVAMVYQTVWMAIYDSKHLIKWPLKNFVKQVAVDVVTVLIATFFSSGFELAAVNYFQWVILAVKVGTVWLLVVAAMNVVFYREKMQYLIGKVLRKAI